MLKIKKFLIAGLLILPFILAKAAQPTGAVKFVILNPDNSTVGIPVLVTVQAQKSNNQVYAVYQNDVTLVANGSATGGGLIDIVNGVGIISINDSVAETVNLSLSDTEGTGLDVSSTRQIVFGPAENASFVQSDFWFRDDDGSETSATGWDVENTLQNSQQNPRSHLEYPSKFRLRFGIRVKNAAGTISPQLEFKKVSENESCSSSGGWQRISGSSGKFVLSSSPYFTDSSVTTQQITSGAGFVSGLILSSVNPAPSRSMLKNEKTEYEWVLEDKEGFVFEDVYIFRITDAGSPLDTYQNCPGIFFPPTPKFSIPPTRIRFSGQAFPGGSTFIVDKDTRYEKVLSQGKVLTEDGVFNIEFVGVLQGQHGFGLVIKDSEGRKTQTKFFNIDTISNSLTKKEIFVPPTLGFAKSAVTRGESLVILGYASPGHKVRAEVDGKVKIEADAGDDGSYKIIIPTGELEFGTHGIYAKQVNPATKQESDLSPLNSFTVSRLQQVSADLSSDNVVDIRDWSIFLALWGSKKKEEARGKIDFNNDGKIDVSDFSIFIRSIKRK
ncbi:MAG: hypothetical protein HYY55_00895 [Candidatus Niyogibacteria bacterium]|nr:MAG: hypothetical protein HYY55_00895 [Candidatus Niyogibacteria bacterium]